MREHENAGVEQWLNSFVGKIGGTDGGRVRIDAIGPSDRPDYAIVTLSALDKDGKVLFADNTEVSFDYLSMTFGE